MWFYRRMLRISWKDKKTNISILQELNTKRELVYTIVKRKMTYFGHAMRHPKCLLMKDVITGKTNGKRGRGRPRTSYMKNLSDWYQKIATPKIFCWGHKKFIRSEIIFMIMVWEIKLPIYVLPPLKYICILNLLLLLTIN